MFGIVDESKVQSYSVALRDDIKKLPTNTERGKQDCPRNDTLNDLCSLGSDAICAEDGSVWLLFPKSDSLEGEWIEQ